MIFVYFDVLVDVVAFIFFELLFSRVLERSEAHDSLLRPTKRLKRKGSIQYNYMMQLDIDITKTNFRNS